MSLLHRPFSKWTLIDNVELELDGDLQLINVIEYNYMWSLTYSGGGGGGGTGVP